MVVVLASLLGFIPWSLSFGSRRTTETTTISRVDLTCTASADNVSVIAGPNADAAAQLAALPAEQLDALLAAGNISQSRYKQAKARGLLENLAKYSAFSYAFFPGTYYNERLKKTKLNALVNATWFAGSAVNDSDDVAGEAPGVRCMMINKGNELVVVFRGTDLGRAAADGRDRAPPNAGDLEADHALCERGGPAAEDPASARCDAPAARCDRGGAAGGNGWEAAAYARQVEPIRRNECPVRAREPKLIAVLR